MVVEGLRAGPRGLRRLKLSSAGRTHLPHLTCWNWPNLRGMTATRKSPRPMT